jgi:hypothetical protein
MWLPKVERKLLIFYAAYDSDFLDHEETFSFNQLRKLLSLKPWEIKKYANQLVESEQTDSNRLNNDSAELENNDSNQNQDITKAMPKFLEEMGTIECSNKRLQERGLLKYRECGPRYYAIKLDLAGWDLGRKYCSTYHTFLLWCNEYKLILTIIGLILTILIVIFTGISALRNK